jgi:predicted DNA-binding mobile mystery protein A
MLKNKLFIEQLDQKIQPFVAAGRNAVPPRGWINAIRSALNMSLRQLGKRLAITPQATKGFEERELDGTITLKRLGEIAQALDMQLVYGFIPKDGTLEALLHRKAKEMAEKSMQYNGTERAIKARTEIIKETLPRRMWE